jgi:hypothetical protein
MRVARWVLAVLVAVLSLGGQALPAAAQDDGVDFQDLVGVQSAITRTFQGDALEAEFSPEPGGPRDALKPGAGLLLVGIFAFDTEANATAGYNLLITDMNATGTTGPLPLTDITLDVGLTSTAKVAIDPQASPVIDFALVIAQDGNLVYSMIAITTGRNPAPEVAGVLRTMAATPAGSGAASFSADGSSTGGQWDKIPTREALARQFASITSVVDAQPLPG